MPPVRPLTPTSLPHIEVMLTDDGSRTLLDHRLNETYHSGCGALAECYYVYLRNSGLEDRMQAGQQRLRVLEFGFGTGMACLLTVAASKAYHCPIQYISLEHALLPRSVLELLRIGEAVDLAIAEGRLPSPFRLASELERAWLDRLHAAQTQAVELTAERQEILWPATSAAEVRVVLGDAAEIVAKWPTQDSEKFDAIYFDAFSPTTNPELWNSQVFNNLRKLLAEDGRLVSYCVSGNVRRGLQAAGFQVSRLAGPPGGKREVLLAEIPTKK